MEAHELESVWGCLCAKIHEDLIESIRRGVGTGVLEDLREELPAPERLRETALGGLFGGWQ